MEFVDNPFYFLEATPRDNRQRIMELAEEKSLFQDPDLCNSARSELTNPRKRLSLELSWLPGVSPGKAKSLLEQANKASNELLKLDSIDPLAKSNLLACALNKFTTNNPQVASDWFIALSKSFDDIDTEKLITSLNDERVVSGFPEITDTNLVDSELKERRRYYRGVMKNALDRLESRALISAATIAIESATDMGNRQAPVLLNDLIDAYEIEVQSFLDKEAENVTALIDRIRSAVMAVMAEADGKEIDSLVDKLILVTENWDNVAQPIQVSTKSRGLDHDASRNMAYEIRGLTIDIVNNHGHLEVAQKITGMLQSVFAEVVDVAEMTADDANVLGDMVEKRAEYIEQAVQQAEQWREDVTYETEIGAIFKDKLRISPDGIEWKGKQWKLDSIKRVRWGGVKHSVNGIPTGTTYTIEFGDGNRSGTIELKKEHIYTKFLDCLWRTVGMRLMTDMLEGLKEGKQYRFGNAVFTDTGVELEKKHFFSSNERIFCEWHELAIWNGGGTFSIGKKEDKKLNECFSYLDQDNVHVLEAAIRMYWKTGGHKISSLLDG